MYFSSHSGGTLVAWNPFLAELCAFTTVVGILLQGKLLGFAKTIHLLNIYGPYGNRQAFWESVFSCGVLTLPNLILAGDLNFTCSSDEVWGIGLLYDPLADYFISLFVDTNL